MALWIELLDAGYEHDADLYRAWVPEQIFRDFHGASIRRKDLALYTGLFAGEAVPAPGRQLRDWESEALDQMAAHLVGLGFEVLDERPAVEEAPNDWGDPTLGGLRVRRYGWEATGVDRWCHRYPVATTIDATTEQHRDGLNMEGRPPPWSV